MKITLFGNTNNLPYLLARALRVAGHDAQLVVNQDVPLHRPENVHPNLAGNYPHWIHDVSHIGLDHYIGPSPAIVPVIRILEYSDGVILNHVGPSLLPHISNPAITLLTGSDLDYFARFQTIDALTQKWSPDFKASASAVLYCALWTGFIERQREGILHSRAVSFFPRGLVPDCDMLLDEIGVTDARRIHLYMADDNIKPKAITSAHERVRIFCCARLNWVKPRMPGTSELDYKGIDVLIRGLARFYGTSGTKVELRLVEKGSHVAETRQLVQELNLQDQVVWLPEMDRAAFDRELNEADICVDQLAQSVVGMGGVDAMLIGKPLLANGRPDVWYKNLPAPPPICHAGSDHEVAEQLMRLVPNRGARIRIGKESSAYVRKYWSPAANAGKCLQILAVK